MNFFLPLPTDQNFDSDGVHQKEKKNQLCALYFVFILIFY
jgi:hypothetical protein